MRTLLIAMVTTWQGQYVPVRYELAPIICASVIQDIADGNDPRVADENGVESPPLEFAACIEVSK